MRPDDQALEVYHCDFEAASDRNFDQWPDGWTRRRGRGYPFYLPVDIIEDAQGSRPTPQHCLQLELDGGAADVRSPPIEISPLFSYVLYAYLKTDRLEHNVAYCAVTFLDEQRQRLETTTSPKVTRADDWTKLVIGPITPTDSRARWAMIELHLEPTDRSDLIGNARFDDLWFGRLPRMSIVTNNPYNVFTDPEEVEITCRISGFSDDDPLLKFELIDVDGAMILSSEQPVRADRAADGRAPRPRPAGADSRRPTGFSGSAIWRPQIPGNGFFTIKTSLPGRSGAMIERAVQLAVVESQPRTKWGEFGWSLPGGDHPLSLRDLSNLLREAGVHWVKFPIWYSDEEKGRADQLARFAERLSVDQMRLVGLLDDPPDNVRKLFGDDGQLPVASVFVEPAVWRPAVDPVMTRLSLKVRWWQLGGDRDTSFVNFPNLEEKVRGIRRDLNRFGQEINLGIALRSIDESPTAANPPWSFLSYTADPPLTAAELGLYFPPDAGHRARRWLVLDPLARSDYDLPTRASDLVLRMIAAKMQKIDGIFIPDPFDAERGLMDSSGSPTELLLAWRTTAIMISGTNHLGSITLPNGSQNHVFVRGKDAVMVVWNDHAVEETIYLGEDVHQIDLWGRRRVPASVTKDEMERQVIRVGPLPTFVTGVNPVVARWRMAFEFETQRLASVFGQQQTAAYHFANTFNQGVGGVVTLDTPIVAESRLTTTKIKLAADELQRAEFQVALGANVNSGPQPVRADFTIGADQTYRFSVYRTIQVGLGDVEVELSSQLDEKGNLVVEQHLVNSTDQFVSFSCLLFVEGRRRQRRQVYNLGRGRATNVFVFDDGAALIGKSLTLRAEEIGGPRVLNHHQTAQR